MTLQLESIISDAWENRATLNTASPTPELRQAVEHVIAELDAGRLRVAMRNEGPMSQADLLSIYRRIVVDRLDPMNPVQLLYELRLF